MLKVDITQDNAKLKQQIAALTEQISKDTNEKDKKIHETALLKLKQESLYRYYLSKQSSEFRKEIINYRSMKMKNTSVAIRVNFTWGWLHVYKTIAGNIEWY